jgi:hypothetical protein
LGYSIEAKYGKDQEKNINKDKGRNKKQKKQ